MRKFNYVAVTNGVVKTASTEVKIDAQLFFNVLNGYAVIQEKSKEQLEEMIEIADLLLKYAYKDYANSDIDEEHFDMYRHYAYEGKEYAETKIVECDIKKDNVIKMTKNGYFM